MRAHFRYWLFRLCLLFMTVAPAFADDTANKDAKEPTVHATPAMWTVHGPKGTAYLLGSFHALPKNVEWQTPAIKAAVKGGIQTDTHPTGRVLVLELEQRVKDFAKGIGG